MPSAYEIMTCPGGTTFYPGKDTERAVSRIYIKNRNDVVIDPIELNCTIFLIVGGLPHWIAKKEAVFVSDFVLNNDL